MRLMFVCLMFVPVYSSEVDKCNNVYFYHTPTDTKLYSCKIVTRLDTCIGQCAYINIPQFICHINPS